MILRVFQNRLLGFCIFLQIFGGFLACKNKSQPTSSVKSDGSKVGSQSTQHQNSTAVYFIEMPTEIGQPITIGQINGRSIKIDENIINDPFDQSSFAFFLLRNDSSVPSGLKNVSHFKSKSVKLKNLAIYQSASNRVPKRREPDGALNYQDSGDRLALTQEQREQEGLDADYVRDDEEHKKKEQQEVATSTNEEKQASAVFAANRKLSKRVINFIKRFGFTRSAGATNQKVPGRLQFNKDCQRVDVSGNRTTQPIVQLCRYIQARLGLGAAQQPQLPSRQK